jgi:maleate isomerase
MSRPYRIGQIVPSSNTTMETEIPAILRAREAVEPERFTFHSSRMRMKKVTKEELAAMDADSTAAPPNRRRPHGRAGLRVPGRHHGDGQGYHRDSQQRLHDVTVRGRRGRHRSSPARALWSKA